VNAGLWISVNTTPIVTTVTWDCTEGHSVNQWWGLLLRGSCSCKRWTA